MDNRSLLTALWHSIELPDGGLDPVTLDEAPAILPSSFRVGDAAQVSTASAAAIAALIHSHRTGVHQSVTVSRPAAERECTGLYHLDGEAPNVWEKFSGLYPAGDGHVRVHANFAHHRDGALALLGLGNAQTTSRDDVERALASWRSVDFETAAAEVGLPVSAFRTFEAWDEHPQAIAMKDVPPVMISRTGDAPVRELAPSGTAPRPLSGIRVLDLTRILAGPVCGRTLAAYGADVMLVNGPHLPNIAHVIDTSRGKRSVHLDFRQASDRDRFLALAKEAHVVVQGYRPGAIAGWGFGEEAFAAEVPGLVSVSLSAYGSRGPWSGKKGFDSLVQTATGFNDAEATAFGGRGPRPMPAQILDFASGFLMAFGAQAALYRQMTEGGSWHVEVSLLATANWLRRMGRVANTGLPRPELETWLEPHACRHGELLSMPHGASFSETPATWQRAAAMPGSDVPDWLA